MGLMLTGLRIGWFILGSGETITSHGMASCLMDD